MRQDAATRRQRVLELLAEGHTPQEAAAQLGVSLRTVRAYLAAPDVRATLRRLRDERLQRLAGRALADAAGALTALRAMLNDPLVSPAVRVSAASKLLDVALRLTEQADLAERVEVLEELVQERGGRYACSA
jgi:predicted ArsR family transcriptional regulator